MEKLIAFIESRYNMAYYWGNAKEMCSQAFGALEFYYSVNPDQFTECERLWNEEWHPKFLALQGL